MKNENTLRIFAYAMGLYSFVSLLGNIPRLWDKEDEFRFPEYMFSDFYLGSLTSTQTFYFETTSTQEEFIPANGIPNGTTTKSLSSSRFASGIFDRMGNRLAESNFYYENTRFTTTAEQLLLQMVLDLDKKIKNLESK